ncbi:MAG: MurR/RpiR family transcriptional regulator [Spirochaetes bacterium]|nr:MurR/RpiR family transcriptional regulator [Spirochaetota bacterium]
MAELGFIADQLHRLRKSEVKVAEWVLSSPDEVIHFSVSELADRVGVSEPTVIRFCRGLGFKGFQDFKIHLAQTLIPSARSIHEIVNGTEEPPELIKKVFEANIKAIQNTLSTLDYRSVDTVVKILSKSEKIIFFGLGGSAVVAMDAYHKFFRIGIPCEWFSDSHMAIMASSMMRKNQTLIAISHSGSSKDVVETIEEAKKAGAETVAIVSQKKSPVTKLVHYVLCVDSPETNYKFEPMSSRIAQLSVIDVLSVGVAFLRSDEVLENLAKSRKALVAKRY